MTTTQLIAKLTAHYGSPQAVNRAAAEVQFDAQNNRLMLKVDALWILYHRLNPTAAKQVG